MTVDVHPNEQPDRLDAIYPVGEKQPERVRTRHGHPLGDLTLDNLLAGRVTASDFGITAEGLRLQAAIAEQAGRPHLAQNLRRGAELVEIPDDELLEVYEQLRPGRARSAADLQALADRLRRTYAAEETARLIEEAVSVYEWRGIFERGI
jgi:propanediol dehydratase small subunit